MKITNTKVYGLKTSIIDGGLPMVDDVDNYNPTVEERMGASTMKLAQAKQGSGHDNFIKGIVVQFRIKWSLAIWKQAQRYHWFDFISSTSTMHRIVKMDIDAHCTNDVYPESIKRLNEDIELFNSYVAELGTIMKAKKVHSRLFNRIARNIPTGFELEASMTTNYQQLKTMYHQRKGHIMEEWEPFAEWVQSLPLSEMITKGDFNLEEFDASTVQDEMLVNDLDAPIGKYVSVNDVIEGNEDAISEIKAEENLANALLLITDLIRAEVPKEKLAEVISLYNEEIREELNKRFL